MFELTEADHTQMFIEPVEKPAFEVQGVLYFLDGHYLFTYPSSSGNVSKFVTAPDLAAAFSQTEQDTGWFTSGVVRAGHHAKGDWFVYTASEQTVDVILDAQSSEVFKVAIPRTVLLGIDRVYYLWALKGKYFLPNEVAYHAPFPNIYQNGKICWGQNTPPQASGKSIREAWELFFKAPFNADLSANKSRSHSGDVRDTLRKLAETKARAYPKDDLIFAGAMIGSLVEAILKEG
jgi:PRTRC genetic system protein B